MTTWNARMRPHDVYGAPGLGRAASAE